MPSPDRPKSGGADSEYFIGPLKANIFSELKTFPKVTDYFKVKFYFLNTSLNSIEHIHYSPQQKNNRTDAWF